MRESTQWRCESCGGEWENATVRQVAGHESRAHDGAQTCWPKAWTPVDEVRGTRPQNRTVGELTFTADGAITDHLWILNIEEVHLTARALVGEHVLTTPGEVCDFFEKPWHWSPERDEIVADETRRAEYRLGEG